MVSKTRTKAGMAIEAMAKKVEKRKSEALTETVAVRVTKDLAHTLDAMAKQLKVERADVVRMLLSAAVQEAIAESAEPVVLALKKAGAASRFVEPQL